MKIVIDIPESTYNWVKNTGKFGVFRFDTAKAIKNGIVLPKHGRLIDADVLVDGFEDNYEFGEVVNATPTVLEASKDE